MKKTSKYIALAALALGFAACTQDDDFAPQQEDIVKIASANIATEVQTRVNTLADGTIFENTDQILLVNNSRDNKNSGTYTCDGTNWSLTEGLVLYASGAYATNDFTAYYPAASDEDYTLPTDQSTATLIKQADRMVATATGVEKGAAVALSFERRNAMVTIVPTIADEFAGQSVSSLQIAGITPYHPADAEDYTAIIAPSDEGFDVKVKVGDSDELLTATTSTAIEAGKRYTFNLKVGKDLMKMETVSVAPWNQQGIGDGNAEEIPYLTFTAEAKQTMKITILGNYTLHESLQYSVNEDEWQQLTANNSITFGGDRGALRLRGKSLGGTSAGDSGKTLISFGDSNVEVACSGDIRTLVDYANYATVSTANAEFRTLFRNCTSLTTAPKLPATTLARFCYLGMFENCTSLTKAPELPATTLADGCYKSMFINCTSLTTAPELPARELAENCYYSMFEGCTSLTAAPEELPATTLAENCYYYMFEGCTSLTTAPELPATELAENCYYYMFYRCTSLTTAPELPATELALRCYQAMFCGCTNLTEAPELPATTLTQGCYTNMFRGCTNLTKAPELPVTTLAQSCYQAMFYGCTNLTEAPELPATTLAQGCYNEMFSGCTGLTEAPELPATTLVNTCYKYMFKGCSALNNITMLATSISATDCLLEWVTNVPAGGTFTKAASLVQGSETGQIPTGVSGIPEGWTVEEK